MVRKVSRSTARPSRCSEIFLARAAARFELTLPRVNLLAVVSWLSLLPACTLVVGERPTREDAASDEPDADATTEEDAATEQDAALERDAGFDGGTTEDGGATLDATSASDAAPSDAALADAASDAGATSMDSGAIDGAMDDDAMADAGPAPDCGTSAGSLWYPDGDEDGYGRSAEAVQSCSKPASGTWASRGGDCKDNDRNVHPEQTIYFGTPYRAANGSDSYDYDCSGSEEGNPSRLALPAGCDGILDVLNCRGMGYLREARTGAGVNPVCGSTRVGTCTAMLLSCTTAMETGKPAYECK